MAGPEFGFVLHAGDGGIEVVRRFTDSRTSMNLLLKTTESLEINSYVSLAVTKESFEVTVIKYEDDLSELEMFISSDGVDRTLQLSEVGSHAKLKLGNSIDAHQSLQRLTELKDREADNYSIARVKRIVRNSEERKQNTVVTQLRQVEGADKVGSLSEQPSNPEAFAGFVVQPRKSRELRHAGYGSGSPGKWPIWLAVVVGVLFGAALGYGMFFVKENRKDKQLLKQNTSPDKEKVLLKRNGEEKSENIPAISLYSLEGDAEKQVLNKKGTAFNSLANQYVSKWADEIRRNPNQGYTLMICVFCSEQDRNKGIDRANKIEAVIKPIMKKELDNAEYQRLSFKPECSPCMQHQLASGVASALYLIKEASDSRR